MSKKKVLLAAQNTEKLLELFPSAQFEVPAVVSSIQEARRSLSVDSYDFIAVRAPLNDEFGIYGANDLAALSNMSILLLVPPASLDQAAWQCQEHPVFVLPLNAPTSALVQAVDFMEKSEKRRKKLEKALAREKQKFAEEKIIALCKIRLLEVFGWPEAKAHAYIQKKAMDTGHTRVACAKAILRKIEVMESES